MDVYAFVKLVTLLRSELLSYLASLLAAPIPGSPQSVLTPTGSALLDPHHNTSLSSPHSKHLRALDDCLDLSLSTAALLLSTSPNAVGFERETFAAGFVGLALEVC
jgi:hypothetical protein